MMSPLWKSLKSMVRPVKFSVQDSELQIVFILHRAASDTKSCSEERLKVIK